MLDASALLCLLFEEEGAENVVARLTRALVSAVNYSKVIAKLVDRGMPADDVIPLIAELDIELMPVDRAQAEEAGLLRAITKAHGLSLGDRACLALTRYRDGVALTADRAWTGLDAGIAIEFVRPAWPRRTGWLTLPVTGQSRPTSFGRWRARVYMDASPSDATRRAYAAD